MNKFQFKKKLKTQITILIVQIHYNLQNHPNFHSDQNDWSSLKEEESVLLSLSSYFSLWCGAMK